MPGWLCTALAAAGPGSSAGNTGQPCQPVHPLRQGSSLLRQRGTRPSDPPLPGLQATFSEVTAGGNQGHLQLFLASVSQFSKFGAVLGCRAHPHI